MVPWNSASGGFAYIWQSKWVGIIAIKIKETQIHFLSDVLVAVASSDPEVPIVPFRNHQNLWIISFSEPSGRKAVQGNNFTHTWLSKWLTQMTKTLKNVIFFIFYHLPPGQPAGKVQSFGPGGWGESGQITTNFSMFFLWSISRVKRYSPALFFEKMQVYRFFVDAM